MPNIREYNSPIDGLRPSDQAASAAARSGNANANAWESIGKDIGSTIAQVGGAWDDQKTREETSHGAATLLKVQLAKTQEWNELVNRSDPNDPTIGEKFRESTAALLDDLAPAFTTKRSQAWYEDQKAGLLKHFGDATVADQAALAGVAAKQNAEEAHVAATNIAELDPSSVPMLIKNVDGMLSTFTAHMDGVQGASVRSTLGPAMKKGIVAAAFKGMVNRNPQAALEALDKGYGNEYLDSADRDKLRTDAEQGIRTARVEASAAAVEARRVQKEAIDKDFAVLTASTLQPDGSTVYPKDFPKQLQKLAEAGAEPGRVSAALNAYQQSVQDAVEGTYRTTDKPTFNSLYSRVGKAASDPEALTDTRINLAYKQLSPKDRALLLSMVPKAGAADSTEAHALNDMQEAARQLKPMIDKSTYMRVDPAGGARYQAFEYAAGEKFRALIASGKSPAEASRILRDPSNPEGLQAMLRTPGNPYMLTNKQSQQALTTKYSPDGGGAAAVPSFGTQDKIRPGESPADYLKRIGK